MTLPADEHLLDRFRHWLEATRAGDGVADLNGSAATTLGDEPDGVGLYRLAEEFTALRHEVKLQTRSGRGVEEEAEKLLVALRQALDALRSIEPREAQAAWSAGKGLALALGDLDEALDRGREQLEKAGERLLERPVEKLLANLDEAYARQSWLGRRRTRKHHEQARRLIRQSAEQPEARGHYRALLDGYAVIQQRLARALAAEGVIRIATIGEPVDPERMIVVAVAPAPGRGGLVVQEVRRGYTWQGRILRCAEVSASSIGSLEEEIDKETFMDVIIGIDLGTTNSEVAVIQDGRPVVLTDAGDPILPSIVGLDPSGQVLVGRAARNQWALAPDRTIRSIKRQMGQATNVKLGDQTFLPQEISAIILRALKARAEQALGHGVSKAVITVPALFNEGQRQATREAGELAGLEVVRIINEPTAAVLTYDPHPPEMERLLVYDLGGGTFDVSIAQVEHGVVEILSSHGDTRLGGDDFDQRLLDLVCDRFQSKHGVDPRESLAARSRLLGAVEEAKKSLSSEPIVTVAVEFVAEKAGVPLNLSEEIARGEYEELIEPLLAKTLRCVDDALSDARLQAQQIHKVLLVGGATRTPLVQNMLAERLGRPVHNEIEPDLAVAMGAAVQGGLIAGVDVGPVLVDITPRTLGIEALGYSEGIPSHHAFSPIIARNTPLPVARTEMYSTVSDGQDAAEIRVFQGEEQDTRLNELVGNFTIRGLANVPSPNQILVRLELDLNGILRVTATERATGLAKQVVIDNAMERLRRRSRLDSLERLDAMYPLTGVDADDELEVASASPAAAESLDDVDDPADRAAMIAATALIARSADLAETGAAEDAAEVKSLAAKLQDAVGRREFAEVRRLIAELDDLVFYLADRA